MRTTRRALLLAPLALAAPPARAQTPGPLLVFAAASLQRALTAAGEAFTRETGRRVTFSFAATSALVRQLEQGAPADVLASADVEWMDWAAERRLIRADTRRDVLGNTLVLIAPADWTGTLAIGPGMALLPALGDSRLALGNPRGVPVGRYAEQALTRLGVWDAVKDKVAAAADVRAVVNLVARGEVGLGVVYASDAADDARVRVVGVFPAETHAPIVYPFAVTAASRDAGAPAFLAFLATQSARAIFAARGFTTLP
jgi:molybdate transport system substrate-binding protein